MKPTDEKRLRELARRYDAAETSLEEERELRELLRDPGLPQAYAPYRQLLTGAEALRRLSPEVPWAEPTGAREPAAPGSQARARLRPARRGAARRAWAAAAAAALLLCAGALLWRGEPDARLPDPPTATIDWTKYEVTDAAEATRITRAALSTVSRRLDRSGHIASREVARLEPIQRVL